MRDFATLFKGREDAHGKYFSLQGRKPTDRGKIVSKAKSVTEQVIPALFAAHLAGEARLGIIPVRKDATTGWICNDIDFYELSGGKTLREAGGYQKIAKAVSDCALPVVITASKSGGAHLWTFFEKPIPADDARKIALSFLAKLNLPSVLGINQKEFDEHVDTFPENASPDDIGIWVNLPYFGDTCHCVGEDGDADLTLQQFVEFANKNIANLSDLKFKQVEKVKAKGTSDAPPCIDFMREKGVPEGHRNDCITQFAIYALKAFPDDWEEKTREFNEDVCDPPLRHDEVTPILKSVGLKKYEGYMCKAMQSVFCDKKECKKRAFGIGKEAVGDLGIEHMEKIDGEDPIYRITIEGKTFSVNAEILYRYPKFRLTAMQSLNRLLPNMKQEEWEQILQDHLEMMEITEAAVDTQMRDRVIRQFQQWCSQSCVTDDFEAAMEANCPFYDGKTILFSGDALLSQLDRHLHVQRDEAFVYMRDWGTAMKNVDGKTLWCWVQHGPLWFDANKGKKR